MKKEPIKDEYFDDELQEVLDGRFTDSTDRPKKKEVMEAFYEQIEGNHPKTEQKSGRIPMVKRVLAFGALSALICYWWTDMQMATTAAIPSLYVCALCLGGSIGKYFK